MNHLAFSGFKWDKKKSILSLTYWLRKGRLVDCWIHSTYYFIVYTPLLKPLSICKFNFLGRHVSTGTPSEMTFLRFVFLTSRSQIYGTVVRETISDWKQTNCNGDYLVVSKYKVGINVIGNLLIVSASSYFMGLDWRTNVFKFM